MARQWHSFRNSIPRRILKQVGRLFGLCLCSLFLILGVSTVTVSQVSPPATEIDSLEASLAEYRQQGDILNQAATLSNLSLAYQQQGNWREAEDSIQQSLGLLADYPVTTAREEVYAETNNILGRLYFAKGEFARALTAWENTVNLYSNLAQPMGVQRGLINQGKAMQELGLFDRACTVLLQATGLKGQLEGVEGINYLDCKQFLALKQTLRLTLENESIQQQWQQFQEGKLSEQAQGELFNTINIDEQLETLLDRPNSFVESYRDIQAASVIPKRHVNLLAARRLGEVLQVMGELEVAKEVLTDLKNSLSASEQQEELLAVNLSLANTERLLGKRFRAIKEAQEVPSFEFTFCRNTAENPPYNNALQLYQENEDIYNQIGQGGWGENLIARSRLNYFSLAVELNDSPTLNQLQQKITKNSLFIQNKRESDQQLIHYIQSQSCLNNPQWNKLREKLQKVVNRATQRGDWRMAAYAEGYIGTLYEQEYKQTPQTKSLQLLNQAKQYTELALKQVKPRGDKAINFTYQLHWQLGRIAQETQPVEKAINYYTTSFTELQELRTNIAAFNQEVQYNFRDKVEPVYRVLTQLLLTSELPISQEKLQQARQVIEGLQLAQLDSFLQDSCIQSGAINIEQIDQNAAVIYTITLPDSLDIILSLPNTPLKHYRQTKLPNQLNSSNTEIIFLADIDSFFNTVNENLKNTPNPLIPNPEELLEKTKTNLGIAYQLLIQPLKNELNNTDIKTLVFVLDNSLQNFPVSALYNQDTDQYLIEEYAVAVTPGLQLLKPQQLNPENVRILAAGISDFEPIAEKLGEPWVNLPGVSEELNQIERLIPSTETLLNTDFTRDTFREKINSLNFPIVHIATHGKFATSAKDTFILAWDQMINLEQLGQLLRVNDPTRTNDIELLIFSACQTASGNKRATLGMAGAAVEAGARSIIATLWNVNDQSTALLMSNFYQQFQEVTPSQTVVNKAEALRAAQLSILQQEKYQNPHFWAPFTLVGNWL